MNFLVDLWLHVLELTTNKVCIFLANKIRKCPSWRYLQSVISAVLSILRYRQPNNVPQWHKTTLFWFQFMWLGVSKKFWLVIKYLSMHGRLFLSIALYSLLTVFFSSFKDWSWVFFNSLSIRIFPHFRFIAQVWAKV